MELGVHLPLIEFGGEAQTLARITRAADAANACGFAAVSANDHLLFASPWLDGPTALAAVLEHTGAMELATTVALVSVRGPAVLAKTLAALDVLSGGRVVAGVGPGSSARDYAAAGVPFDDRWPRFDEAVAVLRTLLQGAPPPATLRFHTLPDAPLEPAPRRPGGIPLWIGSWGSPAGLRRVTRLADGWLASAYNTTPEAFDAGRAVLGDAIPAALATMWTWITEDAREADRVLREVLGPLLRRDPEVLREQLCVGPAERCAELLDRYARAGCTRAYLWPIGDEVRQIERAAGLTASRSA